MSKKANNKMIKGENTNYIILAAPMEIHVGLSKPMFREDFEFSQNFSLGLHTCMTLSSQ